MKVAYVTTSGFTSTAYLDESLDRMDEPAVWAGVDKHTDEPVTVALTDGGWVQVPSP